MFIRPVMVTKQRVLGPNRFAEETVATATTTPQAGTTADTLRVLTYNMEFLHPTQRPATRSKSDTSRWAAAQVIAKADPDLALLQEVLDRDALLEFLDDYLTPELQQTGRTSYKILTYNPEQESTGQGAGKALMYSFIQPILYREPLQLVQATRVGKSQLKDLPGEEPMLGREFLMAEFAVPTPHGRPQPLLVANCHLSPNLLNGIGSFTFQQYVSSCQRLREAYAIQQVIGRTAEQIRKRTGLEPRVIVGGDLNAHTSWASSESILDALKGKTMRAAHASYDLEHDRIMPTTRKVAFDSFRLHDGTQPVPLTELTPRQPTLFNTYYRESHFPDQQFDYLLSDPITQKAATSLTLRDPQDRLEERLFRMASDHDPLAVQINLKQLPPGGQLSVNG